MQRFSIANDVNIIIHDLQYYSTDTHAIKTCEPDRITVHVGLILPNWKNFILQFLGYIFLLMSAWGVVSSHHIVWADNLHIEIYQKTLTNDDCTRHAPKEESATSPCEMSTRNRLQLGWTNPVAQWWNERSQWGSKLTWWQSNVDWWLCTKLT